MSHQYVIRVTRGEETHVFSSYAKASVEECDNECHTDALRHTDTHTAKDNHRPDMMATLWRAFNTCSLQHCLRQTSWSHDCKLHGLWEISTHNQAWGIAEKSHLGSLQLWLTSFTYSNSTVVSWTKITAIYWRAHLFPHKTPLLYSCCLISYFFLQPPIHQRG